VLGIRKSHFWTRKGMCGRSVDKISEKGTGEIGERGEYITGGTSTDEQGGKIRRAHFPKESGRVAGG